MHSPERTARKTERDARRTLRAITKTPIMVPMPDGTIYPVRTILTNGKRNVKLAKSDAAGLGVTTYGLTLAPWTSSGFNVCQNATEGCGNNCLRFTGHNTYRAVHRAQVAKTRAFFLHRSEFLEKLRAEITLAQHDAERRGNRLAMRLNVLSDLPWERIVPSLFSDFPRVVFYDYTKVPNRITPANYTLTFSRSETNESAALTEYQNGRNVAVVFRTKTLPSTWNGIPVFNGDQTDLRFLDGRGVVGLYAKGRAKHDASGFVVDVN